MGDGVEVITDEKWREQFALVHRLVGEATAFHAQTQTRESEFGLSFEIQQHGHPVKLAVLIDRQTLVELTRRILSTLDPVTNEQALEKIRKLVENRGGIA